jgi:hypothetical protein
LDMRLGGPSASLVVVSKRKILPVPETIHPMALQPESGPALP